MKTQPTEVTTHEYLDFSYNWNNKLTGKYFTTLRLYSQKFIPGKVLTIRLKNKEIGTAQVIETRTILLEQINDWISGIDIGYNKEEAKAIFMKMYPGKNWKTQNLVLALLKNITTKKPE